MPHLVNVESSFYLTTNFKVMWSTLRLQDSLTRRNKKQLLKEKLIEKLSLKASKNHYFLVRNPYTRLESFFKDKMRKNVSPDVPWQICQKLFFHHLGITDTHNDDDIAEKLKSFSFESFIHILPKVYVTDMHLHPQFWTTYLGIRNWGWPLQFDQIFKIESDLEELKNTCQIDLSIIQNDTKKIKEEITWTKEMKDIVKKTYHEDFKRYGYEP